MRLRAIPRLLISRVIPRRIKHYIWTVITKYNIPINRKIRSVALIGWIGAFNLGDEMMMDVSVALMMKHGIKPSLIVHEDNDKVRERYSGYTIYGRRPLNDEAISKIVGENEALFVSGGALIDSEGYDSSDSLARDIMRLTRSFIEADKKVIIYGVSTTKEIKDKNLIDDLIFAINNSTYFSVRDNFSREELSKFADKSKVEVVDDIVFADPIISRMVGNGSNPSGEVQSDNDRIGLTLIYNGDTMSRVVEFTDKLLQASKKRIRLIYFYDENNNDAIRAAELVAALSDKGYRVDEMLNPRNSSELKRALEGVDVYISMRYHGTLFANAIGKKVISLDYDTHSHYINKNRYLMNNYGFECKSIKLSDVNNLKVESIAEMINDARSNNKRMKEVGKRARKSLNEAIELL